MGLLDKLLGRGKKAAGDLMGDASMRREGAAQEREGAAEERASQHEEMAQEQRNQAAEAHAERENTELVLGPPQNSSIRSPLYRPSARDRRDPHPPAGPRAGRCSRLAGAGAA